MSLWTNDLQVNKDHIQLLVAVVKCKSKLLVEPRRGVCSTYLASIMPGAGEYQLTVGSMISACYTLHK